MKSAIFQQLLKRLEEDPQSLNCFLKPELITLNEAEDRLVLRFKALEWMKNPAGYLHGGISSSIVDIACGLFAIMLLDGHYVVTVNLSMQYNASLEMDKDLVCEVLCTSKGKRLLSFQAFLRNEGSELPGATALATYSKVKLTEENPGA